MAYTDYTKVGTADHKKVLSAFCSTPIKLTQDELKNGVVLAYLPPKIFIKDFYGINTEDGSKVTQGSDKLQLGGTQLEKKFYAEGGVLEIKDDAAVAPMDTHKIVVVEYLEVDLATGTRTFTMAQTLASDGTVANG